MTLYAFDCSGTLDIGGGPVPLSRLFSLEKEGHKIVIVSPDPKCGGMVFYRITGEDRLTNLKRVKELFPEQYRFVYISDNADDDKRAAEAGFEFVRPENF